MTDSAEHKQANKRLAQLQLTIDRINVDETHASVDRKLSLVLFDSYDLYCWQPNLLKDEVRSQDSITLMVCRLDGPDYDIIKDLVDKAIATEIKGLKGIAYIDSRGITNKATNPTGKQLSDVSINDIGSLTAPDKQVETVANSAISEYKYVTSNSSNIFH